MDLYLMRHGIAAPRDAAGIHSDRERPLTEKGAKRMRRAANGLLNLKTSIDLILTSPLLRAQQTSQIIAEVFNTKNTIEELPELAPEGSVETLLRCLTAYRERKGLLLVGHQPLLGETVSFLLTRGKEMEIRLKKAGLCLVEVDDLPPKKAAILHWMLTPRQLRLLGG